MRGQFLRRQRCILTALAPRIAQHMANARHRGLDLEPLRRDTERFFREFRATLSERDRRRRGACCVLQALIVNAALARRARESDEIYARLVEPAAHGSVE